MLSPISPQLVRIVHKEKEMELERRIAYKIAAKERALAQAASGSNSVLKQHPAWYAQAFQWVKVTLFHRVPVRSKVSSQPEAFSEPCTGLPC